MYVIGSKNSSNSLRLVEVAKRSGCKNTFLIDSKEESKTENILKYKNVGITSGASAPEILLDEVTTYLIEEGAILKDTGHEKKKEDITFSIPKGLRIL